MSISSTRLNNIQNINNRKLFVDILRILATLAVIALHVSSYLAYLFNSIDLHKWWLGNIVDSASRWCVPLFVMISGYLLLDPSKFESNSQFLKKRFVRVIIPLVVWSNLYSLWKTKGDFSGYSFFTEFIQIIKGPVYFHLGFIYIIIALYIVTPILRKYIANTNGQNLIYFISIWVIFSSVIPVFTKYTKINIAIDPSLVTGFIGYYILGYFLANIDISKKLRLVIFVLGIISFLLTAYGTYALTVINSGNLDEYYYGYLMPNVVMMAAAIFLFIKNINWDTTLSQKPIILRGIRVVSNASFGIYLVHPMILELLSGIKINAGYFHPIIGIPVTLSLTFLFSFIVIYFIQRIPILKFAI